MFLSQSQDEDDRCSPQAVVLTRGHAELALEESWLRHGERVPGLAVQGGKVLTEASSHPRSRNTPAAMGYSLVRAFVR